LRTHNNKHLKKDNIKRKIKFKFDLYPTYIIKKYLKFYNYKDVKLI